jgi:multicomponent Na+:H+ antiporter subunit B
MNSLIFKTAARFLVPLMLLFSIYMLIRGHNAPGGGFIGGLIAAIGFAIYAIAQGPVMTRRAMWLDPLNIAMIGLGIAAIAGMASVFSGDPLFTGQWLFLGGETGSKGLPLSTILLFDLGVYLVVLGSVVALVLALEKEI